MLEMRKNSRKSMDRKKAFLIDLSNNHVDHVKINPFHQSFYTKREGRTIDKHSLQLQLKYRDICKDELKSSIKEEAQPHSNQMDNYTKKLNYVTINKNQFRNSMARRYDANLAKHITELFEFGGEPFALTFRILVVQHIL